MLNFKICSPLLELPHGLTEPQAPRPGQIMIAMIAGEMMMMLSLNDYNHYKWCYHWMIRTSPSPGTMLARSRANSSWTRCWSSASCPPGKSSRPPTTTHSWSAPENSHQYSHRNNTSYKRVRFSEFFWRRRRTKMTMATRRRKRRRRIWLRDQSHHC